MVQKTCTTLYETLQIMQQNYHIKSMGWIFAVSFNGLFFPHFPSLKSWQKKLEARRSSFSYNLCRSLWATSSATIFPWEICWCQKEKHAKIHWGICSVMSFSMDVIKDTRYIPVKKTLICPPHRKFLKQTCEGTRQEVSLSKSFGIWPWFPSWVPCPPPVIPVDLQSENL